MKGGSLAELEDDAPKDEQSEELDAAKDALKAIKANDAKAFSLALHRHWVACESTEPDEGDDEEDEAKEY